MKRSEFIKVLYKNGVVFYRSGIKHDVFKKNSTGKKMPLPKNDEIDSLLVKEIELLSKR